MPFIFASGYGLNYFHENNNAVGEQISGFGKGLACQLMADGFFEFLHWSYHSTLNEFYWLKTPQDKEIGLTSFLTSEVEDFRPQALQLQHEVSWNKGVTITRALTSIPFSISFVAQSFMNRSALQYNSVFEHELFVCGGIFSTGYYLSELYSVYNQKGLRQGDIPSMGALAGWFKMVSAPQALAFFPLRSHWGRGNNRISIKYETPHPANIYEGFKLKRVLNSMETALKYNWDEESIRQYMKDHDINRFYRIPKDLLSVLWTRPDI